MSDTFKESFLRTWNNSETWRLRPFKTFWGSIVGYTTIITILAAIFATLKVSGVF